MAVRRAAKIVVVESMQVGDMDAARGEIAGAVQAMGWVAAKATIMEVVQTVVDEGGESASKTLGVDLDELVVAIVRAAHSGTSKIPSISDRYLGRKRESVYLRYLGSKSSESFFFSLFAPRYEQKKVS